MRNGKHKSDSKEQRVAESLILRALESQIGANFQADAKLELEVGVEPDAIDPEKRIVAEVYAHIGPVKGPQLHKIKGDILKLALIGQKLGPEWRKLLAFGCEKAALYARGKSWVAEAAREFNVEIVVVPISDETRRSLLDAQTRQRMVNTE